MGKDTSAKSKKPIVKSAGVNPSERVLAHLCDRAFLKLWAYPNPHKEPGVELCDVLAVFEEHVFIFSIKDISFSAGKTTEVAWERWKNKAIDKSLGQIQMAERWIKNSPEKIFLDAKCEQKFPIPIDKENCKIHRILVAFGAEEACKQYSPENINGSLGISYSDLVNSKKHAKTIGPFSLMLNGEEMVHVLDSYNLPIILSELDTVRDLLLYFEAKEEAIKRHKLVFCGGEEDMLAHYISNFDEKYQKSFIGVKNKSSAIIIDQGLWQNLIEDATYKKKKQMDKASYFWDNLLQETFKQALDGKLIGADVFSGQSPLIEMAKELRFVRREFSEAMLYALKNYHNKNQETLRTRYYTLEDYEHGYVFLQTPPLPDEDYEKNYRLRRQAMLAIACGVIKNKIPHLKKVIGIAMEPPKPNQGSSQDFALLLCEDWTNEEAKHYEEANKKTGCNFFEGANLKTFKGSIYESPPE